jgi:hypothetical protein
MDESVHMNVDGPERTPPEVMLDAAGKLMRIACQVVGLVLVIIAAYYAFQVLFQVLEIVRDPRAATDPVKAVAAIIEADQMKVDGGGGQLVAVGKAVAMALLIAWYGLGVWVPLAVLFVAGRIVAWNFDERALVRRILTAFLGQVKQEKWRKEFKERQEGD